METKQPIRTEEDWQREMDRIHGVLKKIQYKQGTGIKAMNMKPHGVMVQVASQTTDKDTGEVTFVSGPKTILLTHENEDKILMEVHQLFQWWEMHEASENFYYEGRRIYDPHTEGKNR